jgi:MFS superfamily sulfate permease-like transporter
MLTTELFTNAVTVTFIAVLETLISARIADGMTQTTHNQVHTRP